MGLFFTFPLKMDSHSPREAKSNYLYYYCYFLLVCIPHLLHMFHVTHVLLWVQKCEIVSGKKVCTPCVTYIWPVWVNLPRLCWRYGLLIITLASGIFLMIYLRCSAEIPRWVNPSFVEQINKKFKDVPNWGASHINTAQFISLLQDIQSSWPQININIRR